MLATAADLVLVILGFGLIVFIHELGHFLAARWAGIRVLAFAIGFGPPLVTYRRGMGWRRGSSEREYFAALARGESGLSPTEYRFNALPFGGYVKMLGQDDIDPSARSDAADSYQRCPVPKRLVVISAGVVANIILAAALFILVMMVGRKVEPPVIGFIEPGSPAAEAAPVAPEAGRGLREGDRILSIDGKPLRTFDDVVLAAAMAGKGDAMTLLVERPGARGPLEYSAIPEISPFTGMLDLGVERSKSGQLIKGRTQAERDAIKKIFEQVGLVGVAPGARLVEVSERPATGAHDLFEAVRKSQGGAVAARFENPDGETANVMVRARPELQVAMAGTSTSMVGVTHLLGLTGVMRIDSVTDAAAAQGLKKGDVFARLGDAEYPSVVEGIREIRGRAGGKVDIVVLREGADGAQEVTLPGIRVNRKGQIGFGLDETSDDLALLSAPPAALKDVSGAAFTPAAAGLNITPGSKLVEVAGTRVASLAEAQVAIRTAARGAGDGGMQVEILIQRPTARGDGPLERLTWELSPSDVRAVRALSWQSDVPAGLFDFEQTTLRASNPAQALVMGLAETRRVMLMTYLTFARLAQGTVKIEHLKGPVGIAHLGTIVAGRGFIWLLFFLALISVNLAVINFLPLPIVDGGQFLFLLYEWLRGKPVPVGVQNGVTLAGLLLIGGMFLLVTYNDIRNLLGL